LTASDTDTKSGLQWLRTKLENEARWSERTGVL